VIRCQSAFTTRRGLRWSSHGCKCCRSDHYDMCKALSHEIVIANCACSARRRPQQLLAQGRLVNAPAPIYGLILAGGSSSRMHRDKAALQYHGRSQLDRVFDSRRPARPQGFRVGARRPDARSGRVNRPMMSTPSRAAAPSSAYARRWRRFRIRRAVAGCTALFDGCRSLPALARTGCGRSGDRRPQRTMDC